MRATKKRKQLETTEADRIENSIVALGASDAKFLLPEYGLSPVQKTLSGVVNLLGDIKSPKWKDSPIPLVCSEKPVGLILPPIEGMSGIFVAECRPVSDGYYREARGLKFIPSSEEVKLTRVMRVNIKPSGSAALYDRTFANHTLHYETTSRWVHNGRWYPVASRGLSPYLTSDDADAGMFPCIANWAYGVAFPRLWSVSYSLQGAPSVRVLTGLDGVKGLFQMRGSIFESRRAALLHWVRSHNRALPDGNSCSVKGHFRGEEAFDWFGMKCTIRPPQEPSVES